MNSQQAKDLLVLYRPGTSDQEDPEFAPALELAANDPELRTWFQQHCALQTAFLESFDKIGVPDGLKEQIVSERQSHLEQRSRKRSLFVATAAAFALLVLLAIKFFSGSTPDNRFDLFRNRMASDVQRSYPRMDLETSSQKEIRTYLEKSGHGNYMLPTSLEKVASTGCKLLHWHDKAVTMICFNSGTTVDPKTPDLFLFVIDRADLTRRPSDSIEIGTTGNLATAGWSKGDKVYLLAGEGDEAFLKKFL